MSGKLEKYNKNYTLTELVSLGKLQKIQDTFAVANQVASTIVDLEGTPITTPSNHSEVCIMIRSSEQGMVNCKLSAKKLGEKAAKLMRPIHQKCLSCGFSDAAAPIVVDGIHIANWLIGQYYIRDVDEHQIAEYSRIIGVDENKMVQAFQKMPRISKERFECVLEFLWIMANEISNIGYQHLQQKLQTEELKRVQGELERHQDSLEELVSQRTNELVAVNERLVEKIEEKRIIEKEQARLITAIESTVDPIVITDVNAIITYVNPAFEQVTGYSLEEVLGANPKILSSGKHDRAFYTEFWETLLAGEVWRGRFINKKKDGILYHEDATVAPVIDEDGQIINFVAIKRDVTDVVQLESRLQQSNKLEAIGTLAAGVAHEINTPVQYVMANTKFLEEALEDLSSHRNLLQSLCSKVEESGLHGEQVTQIKASADEIDLEYLEEETGEAVEGALEGLERIAGIVKAMKEFSHPGGSQKEPVDLNQIVENTVVVAKSEWKPFAKVQLELQRDLPFVPLLSGPFKQVILILLINAVQAIEKKIKKEKPVDEQVITILTKLLEDKVAIIVQDTGSGIPENVIGKIFDPFFTTKSVGKGTGQGLSIAHKIIVEDHQGTIDVQSEPGKGAVFTLKIPVN